MTKQLPVPDTALTERLRDYERRIKAIEHRGSGSVANLSVPGAVTFGAYTTTFYQGPSDGKTKAAIQLTWAVPTNTDGSEILDGSYYEIRWRATVLQISATLWGGLASHRWGELAGNTWGNPLGSFSTVTSDWHYIRVTWDVTQFSVQELTPGVEYEFEIRAVDTGQIPNLGAWSTPLDVVAAVDTIAPPQPAAPAVAASLIAVQVTHTLGLASGGTYNLPPDLHHLEVHGGADPTFLPSTSTLLGKLLANAGLLTAQIPAVGTFPTSSTSAVYVKVIAVDVTGNKSEASPAVAATATLIDNAHISDLSVSKLTAGTISADIVVGARIKTADSGARVELNTTGIQAYDGSGNQTVNVSAADGTVSLVGSMQSPNYATGATGWRVDGGGTAEFASVAARGTLTTAAAGGSTVLPDGGFEGSISTSGDIGTWSYTTAQHHAGSKSLTVVGDATDVKQHNLVTLAAFTGTTVVVSFWVKAPTIGTTGAPPNPPVGDGLSDQYITVRVRFYDASSVEINSGFNTFLFSSQALNGPVGGSFYTTPTYSDWTFVDGSQTVPAGTAFVTVDILAQSVYGGTLVYVDTATVAAAGTSVTVGTGKITIGAADTTSPALSISVFGDTADRFWLTANGGMNWSDGSSGLPDTVLSRSGSGRLTASDMLIGSLDVASGSLDVDTFTVTLTGPAGVDGNLAVPSIKMFGDSLTHYSSIIFDAEVLESAAPVQNLLYVTGGGNQYFDTGIGNVTRPSTAASPYGGYIGIDRTGGSSFNIANSPSATTYNEISFDGVENPTRQYVFVGKIRLVPSAAGANIVAMNVRKTTPGTGTVVASFNIDLNTVAASGIDYTFQVPYWPNPGSVASGTTNYFVDLSRVAGTATISVERNSAQHQNFIMMIDRGSYAA